MATLAPLGGSLAGSTLPAGGALAPVLFSATGVVFTAGGGGAVTGDLAQTLATLTYTLVGGVRVVGASSRTLAACSVSATNTVASDVTLSSTGTVTNNLAGGLLAVAIVSATGGVVVNGLLSQTLGDATIVAGVPGVTVRPAVGSVRGRAHRRKKLYVEVDGRQVEARDADHAEELEAREAWRLLQLIPPKEAKNAVDKPLPYATDKPELVDIHRAERDQDEEDAAAIL